jgi:tetratricopeptide (TPR) repeat protein
MNKIFFTILSAVILFLLNGCSSLDMSKGSVALELGDYPLAITFFSRVLRRNPGHFGARVGMGKALLQRATDRPGDTTAWREAIMHLQAAQTIHGDTDIPLLLAEAWAERGAVLLDGGDTAGALDALTYAIELHPENPEPLNLAGIINFRLGRLQKARQLLERTVELDSSNASSLFNLGMICWEQQHVRRAYELWRKALGRSPDDEEFQHWITTAEKRLQEVKPAHDNQESGAQ